MKIVFLDTDTMGSVSLEPIKAKGELICYPRTTPEQVPERVADCDVAIVNKVIVDKRFIDSAPKLKLICVAATGTNNVDIEYATSKGIQVRNAAGYSTESVAQVTFMHILNLAGHGMYFDRRVKSGEYYHNGIFSDMSWPFFELKGKRLGIVAMGNIGRRVAEIATVFGMYVSYYSTSGTSHCKDYPSVSLEALLKDSDIVTVHAPLNEHTRDLIRYEHLRLMKPQAFILNMGRGGIINEADLARALKEGVIAGAAIDVFAKEPLEPGHPFMDFADCCSAEGETLKEKLIMSPHIAWTSEEALHTLVRIIADNISL